MSGNVFGWLNDNNKEVDNGPYCGDCHHRKPNGLCKGKTPAPITALKTDIKDYVTYWPYVGEREYACAGFQRKLVRKQ